MSELDIITRAQWDARSPRGGRNRLDDHPAGVTFHWEGPHMGTPHHDACDDLIRGIQRFHMDTRGWSDIAYNFVVCPHGAVYEGRGLGVGSAANGTTKANHAWYAVCFLSGKGDPFTPEMKAAGVRIRDYLCAHGAGDGVTGHRDHKSTSCPGDEIYAWLRAGLPASDTAGPARPTPARPAPSNLTGTNTRRPHVDLIDLRDVSPLVRHPGMKALQRLLDVADDGLGGPDTRAALGRAQSRAGVTRDYIFGPESAEAFLAGKAG